MAKVAFVILAHENAGEVAELAKLLTTWSDTAHAVIHYDLKSSHLEFAKLKAEFAGSERVHVVNNRVRCEWGGFSLIEAPMRALKLIRTKKIACDRVMLISGSCLPTRPLAEFSAFLDKHPHMEFIESHDSSWMTGGLRHERYQYRHIFNFQSQYKLFHWNYLLQRKLFPKRSFPKGLEPRWGSQWWCLSWALCEKILDYVKSRPADYRFFKSTWIPDEMFFQTLAYKFTPHQKLSNRTLTFFQFNDWGKPLVFLDEHEDLIESLPYFFARKIGSRATKLRAHLKALAVGPARKDAPQLGPRDRYVFPLKEKLAALPNAKMNAPTLYHQLGKKGLVNTLPYAETPYVVLYGPPALTARIASYLRETTDLTVLGRIMHPDKVDFGPGVTHFHGLSVDDVEIRKFDGGNYFARILTRCPTPLVFELTPGENPNAERALLQSGSGIVLPIAPASESDGAWFLYWALCLGQARSGVDFSKLHRFRALATEIDQYAPSEFRTYVTKQVHEAERNAIGDLERWRQLMAAMHGDVGNILADRSQGMAAALQNLSEADILDTVSPAWRDIVSGFMAAEGAWRIVFQGYRDVATIARPSTKPMAER